MLLNLDTEIKNIEKAISWMRSEIFGQAATIHMVNFIMSNKFNTIYRRGITTNTIYSLRYENKH